MDERQRLGDIDAQMGKVLHAIERRTQASGLHETLIEVIGSVCRVLDAEDHPAIWGALARAVEREQLRYLPPAGSA